MMPRTITKTAALHFEITAKTMTKAASSRRSPRCLWHIHFHSRGNDDARARAGEKAADLENRSARRLSAGKGSILYDLSDIIAPTANKLLDSCSPQGVSYN